MLTFNNNKYPNVDFTNSLVNVDFTDMGKKTQRFALFVLFKRKSIFSFKHSCLPKLINRMCYWHKDEKKRTNGTGYRVQK